MALAIDANVSTNKASTISITSPSFSTTAANELLLAFVEHDGGGTGNYVTTGVTGGGLTWTKVISKGSGGYGEASIWRAFAASTLSSVTVTATTNATSGSPANIALTVVSFSGVDTTGTGGSGAIGATNTATGNGTGTPSASLTTTRDASWVFGCGNDWSGSTVRTLGSGQTLVYEWPDTGSGNDFWVQRQTSTTATAGTSVTINDTAPSGDKWNLAIVEVLPVSAGGTGTPTQYMSLMGVGSA